MLSVRLDTGDIGTAAEGTAETTAAGAAADAATALANSATAVADAATVAGNLSAHEVTANARTFPFVSSFLGAPETVVAGATNAINISGGFELDANGVTAAGFGGGTWTNPSVRQVRVLAEVHLRLLSALGAAFQVALGGTHASVSPGFNPTGNLPAGVPVPVVVAEVITVSSGQTVTVEVSETGGVNPLDVESAWVVIRAID